MLALLVQGPLATAERQQLDAKAGGILRSVSDGTPGRDARAESSYELSVTNA